MSTDAHGATPQSQETTRDRNQDVERPFPDLKTVVSGDPSVRKVVAEELLAAIHNEDGEIQQRARQLFIEHGYFDEAVRHLREAKDASERAAAAQTLGEFGSDLAAAPLNAALFDDELDVRAAAQSALERIGKQPMATRRTAARLSTPPEPGSPAEDKSNGIGAQASETALQEVAVDESVTSGVTSDEDSATEVHNLLLEENAVRKTLGDLDAHSLELDIALESARNETKSATECVLRFRSEIVELRAQEQEFRRQAEGATSRYESELEKKAEAERDCQRFAEELVHVRTEMDRVTEVLLQLTRKRADVSAARRDEAENSRRIADELYNVELRRLRSEEAALRQAAEKAALRRGEVQQARRAVQEQTTHLLDQQSGMGIPEAARLADIERLHYKVKEQYQSELEQLQLNVEKLSQLTQHVAARRASIEFATRVAEAEAEKLTEAQARLDAAEETSHQAQLERLRLEALLVENIEEERRRVAEAHARLQSVERPIEMEGVQPLVDNEKPLGDFEELRTPQELTVFEQTAVEEQIDSELENIAKAETDARGRIEQAELRRRAAEEACRQLEERVVKVEAEAHRSRLDEEQALAKLETARRQAEAEFQTRADQQKRIREEIEQLRKLEVEERRRVEEEVLRRSQAETRLQQERERFKAEEAARLRAEGAESELIERTELAEDDKSNVTDDPEANLRRVDLQTNEQSLTTLGSDQPFQLPVDANQPRNRRR